VVADQKNSEAYEFIEEISEKGLDLSYQILLCFFNQAACCLGYNPVLVYILTVQLSGSLGGLHEYLSLR
jgi:hypothetical protein